MNINEWYYLLVNALDKKGIAFTLDERNFLLSKNPENPTSEQKEIISEAMDAMTRYFFEKVEKGETFGNTQRIKERFGNTIEENYGLQAGPFVQMAKTYWTYKIESIDLFPQSTELVLSRILGQIESDIASVFFPTPGPYSMPVNQRRERQKELLMTFIPDFDIEKFIYENPILKIDQKRGGCLWVLFLVLVPIGALFIRLSIMR
jgi:hypothetical protein